MTRELLRSVPGEDHLPPLAWSDAEAALQLSARDLGLRAFYAATALAGVAIFAAGLVAVAHALGLLPALLLFAVVATGTVTAARHLRATLAALSGEVEELSSRDQLTGALNAEAFDRTYGAWVGNGLHRQRESALLLVDVDQFDAINRAHGHDVGDAALRHLSAIIHTCIRETDAFARLDGEDFALFFPATSGAEAAVAAERIRSEVARRSGECGAAFTISVGVTGSHAFNDPWAAAERALSLAKSAGCNRVVLAETETQAEPEYEPDFLADLHALPFEQHAGQHAA